MLGSAIRHRRRRRATVRNEPLGGRLGFFPIAPWIAQRGRIGMQDAFSHVEVTTCDPKDILMLRSLMVHTHSLSP